MTSAVYSFAAIVMISLSSCKTTSDAASTKNQNLRRNDQTNIIAESPLSFDVKMLKAHLANAQDPSTPNLGLWSAFLEEPNQDSPCPGKAIETYYMLDKSTDDAAENIYVLSAKPMPMNGPCGLVLDTELKKFNEVSRALIESSPLSEIGTFDKIKFSIKQGVERVEAHYKNFKYRDGVKIYRHLHPTTWNHPWFAIYGTSCGIDSTAYFNAETGEILDMLDSPSTDPCPARN